MTKLKYTPLDFDSLLSCTDLGKQTLHELNEEGKILFPANDYELSDPTRRALIQRCVTIIFGTVSRRKKPDVIAEYIQKHLDKTVCVYGLPYIDDIVGKDITDCNIFRRLDEGSFSPRYLDILRILDIILQRVSPEYNKALNIEKYQQETGIIH